VPLRRAWAWKALALALFVYCAAFPWLALHSYQYQDIVNASPYFGNKAGFGAQRMEIWHGVAEKVMERPWLGHGVEATRSMRFDITKYFPGGTVLHPHNLPLQVWIEFGALGIAVLCAALAFMLRVICMEMRGIARRTALPTFMMSLLIGSTAYGMWQGWWIGLLILLTMYFIMLRRRFDEAEAI
jgi:O-antigen ligase